MVGTVDMGSNEIKRAVESDFYGYRRAARVGNDAWIGVCGLGDIRQKRYYSQLAQPNCNVIWFFLSSAWIGPPSAANAWLIPSAILALLIPFFLVSYLIEYLVVRFMVGMIKGVPPLERLSLSTQTLLHTGRPLYCVAYSET